MSCDDHNHNDHLKLVEQMMPEKHLFVPKDTLPRFLGALKVLLSSLNSSFTGTQLKPFDLSGAKRAISTFSKFFVFCLSIFLCEAVCFGFPKEFVWAVRCDLGRNHCLGERRGLETGKRNQSRAKGSKTLRFRIGSIYGTQRPWPYARSST